MSEETATTPASGGAVRRFQWNGEDAIRLPARREAFPTLKVWLSSLASELRLPEKTKNQILIASDEIFTNIASYGFPGGGGSARVAVEFDAPNEEITLLFSDNGVPYNPLSAPEPDVRRPLVKREIGGLGLFMVRKIMDSVAYRREGNRNLLTLKKKVHRND